MRMQIFIILLKNINIFLIDLDNQQRLFNKYVRESVENRLGKEFLLMHEIQEIDHEVMESIKSKTEAIRNGILSFI